MVKSRQHELRSQENVLTDELTSDASRLLLVVPHMVTNEANKWNMYIVGKEIIENLPVD